MGFACRRWRAVKCTLTDMGASFAIATGGVLTLFIAAPPDGSSLWVRVVNEVSGAVFEQEIIADLPANTQFLSPRLLYEQWGNGGSGRVRLCGGLPRDGLLIRLYRNPTRVKPGPRDIKTGSAEKTRSAERLNQGVSPGPHHTFTVSSSGKVSLRGEPPRSAPPN